MQRVFLEEMLEHWCKGQLMPKEILDARIGIGLTPEQMIAQLVPMLLSQAQQQVKALERRLGGASSDR